MATRHGWALGVLGGLFAVGCSSESVGSGGSSSCGIDTKSMAASLSIQARGGTTTIYAAAFASGNVALECGDVFAATVDGQRMVLAREADSSSSGPIHYTATIPSPAGASTAVIALEREAPKVSAPMSKVYLPAPFSVRDVSTTVNIGSKNDAQFRLDPPMKSDVTDPTPSSVRLRLELEGPCLEPVTFLWSKAGVLFPPLVKADGTVAVVNGSQFMKKKGEGAACDVALHVTQLTAGEIDPAFAGVLGSSPAEGSRHEEASFHLEW